MFLFKWPMIEYKTVYIPLFKKTKTNTQDCVMNWLHFFHRLQTTAIFSNLTTWNWSRLNCSFFYSFTYTNFLTCEGAVEAEAPPSTRPACVLFSEHRHVFTSIHLVSYPDNPFPHHAEEYYPNGVVLPALCFTIKKINDFIYIDDICFVFFSSML